MAKKKILYFCSGRSSFVENDLEIITKEYNVGVFVFRPKTKFYTPLSYLKQFFFILKNIFSADAFCCFFGGHHSLLPAVMGFIFRKPCFIFTGGTDCVSFPSIAYGNFSKKVLGKITEISYRFTTHIVPVHKSLVECDYTYQDNDFPKQGFLYFCKDLKTPYTSIDLGFDPNKWENESVKNPNSFITVAAGLGNNYRMALKGIDLILEAAEKFPNAHFSIVGFADVNSLSNKPKNVKTYGLLDSEQLKKLYGEHEFYLQVSMSEGFPNAICEAMLCSCIPIASTVGAMPDIVGDAGFLLDKRDAEKFEKLIVTAMQCDKKIFSKKAKERIESHYPKEVRVKKVLDLFSKIIS
ncbi:MAG: glycosyltransferase family 4 protein [Bacteroidia bacterium]